MPESPRPDQLSRAELGQLQRKALREWRQSEWLASHDPETWVRLEDVDPDRICVDLGSGVGEAEQKPGYIALDSRSADRRELQARGEDRLPDLVWDISDGLPFEDGSVDDVHFHSLLEHLSEHARTRLPKELARVLAVGGRVTVHETPERVNAFAAELDEHGFDEEDERKPDEHGVKAGFVLQQSRRSLEDIQPHLVDEHVLGTPVIRTPRIPYRS